tara:strand:+ start:209 stop:448 length:240 start_codon:yes stop_codon:yes gene_type:complete
MKPCLKVCRDLDVTCPIKECNHWIDYKDDLNCTLEAVEKNGHMTLREVAKRLGVSFVRIKQIEDKAIKKISLFFDKDSI